MESTEREDLDALSRSDGWQRFLDHVAVEWGTREYGGGARFTMGARQAASEQNEADALAKLRQIVVAQREIHTVIAWVEDRLKDATKAEHAMVAQPVQNYTRRGGL